MPTINRLSVENKTINLSKKNNLRKFNTLNFPQSLTKNANIQQQLQKKIFQTGSIPNNYIQ